MTVIYQLHQLAPDDFCTIVHPIEHSSTGDDDAIF